jgi:hypothetical protein
VTTVLQRTGQSGQAGHVDTGAAAGGLPQPRRSWFARDPAWPIVTVLVGWPAWWALGIENQIFILAAIPMAYRLYKYRAKTDRTIRLPSGFGVWLLFLIVVLAGIFTIALQAPETIQSSVSNRLLAFTYRACDYSAATITLLYVGNLTEQELSRRRLAWLLGLVGIYATIGGLLGVVDPHFGFTSPIAKLLPTSLQSALATSLNPGSSQVMGFLGFAEGRVKAPFTYTNQWGNCIAILLPWLLVAWRNYGTRFQSRAAVAVIAITLVPVVLSLDRGLWVGIVVAVLYLAIRFAGQGKMLVLGVFCGILILSVVVIVASPLGSLVSQRLAHGKSNSIRTSLTYISLADGEASPLIGFGDTRHMQGSTQSIAIGASAGCKKCGNTTVGGNGELQLLLISTGFLGTTLYCAFFAYCMWRYRRDKTPYGMTGVLVLLLQFVFIAVYEAAGPPLGFTMLAIALMWKNDRELRNRDPARTWDQSQYALGTGTLGTGTLGTGTLGTGNGQRAITEA